ncbi:MAG: hypothetical protein RIM33_15165 [Alphaproteobacteria bacterium]
MEFDAIDKSAVLMAALASTVFGALYHWGLQWVWLYAWHRRTDAQKMDRAREEEARREGRPLHPTHAERAGRRFGRPPSGTPARVPPMLDGLVPAFTAGICHILIAGTFAAIAGPGLDLAGGLRTAVLLWMGIAVPFLAIHHGFTGDIPGPVAPEAAHWLGVLLIQGAILGGG